MATRIDDSWAIAKAKQFLTISAIYDADFPNAERLAHEALSAFEENGDMWSESVLCAEVLALLAITLRYFDTAKAWIERGLKVAKDVDFKYSQQMAYWQLGYVAALQENYPEAGKYWREALTIGEEVIGTPIVIGFGGNGTEWGGRKLVGD